MTARESLLGIRFTWRGLSRKSLIALIAVALAALLSAKTILPDLGRFMAPEAHWIADVLIVEGGVGVDSRVLVEAVRQMRSSRAGHLVLVTHETAGTPSRNQANKSKEIETDLRQMG